MVRAAQPETFRASDHALVKHTSAMIQDETIVNADVSPIAAVAYGKLSLTGALKNADVASDAAIGGSKLAGIPETTVHDDATVHSVTATVWTNIHEIARTGGKLYNARVRFNFRTTGVATAYVREQRWNRLGVVDLEEDSEASTTSTTTVTVYFNIFATRRYAITGVWHYRLYARTSDAAVAAEVSREVVEDATWFGAG